MYKQFRTISKGEFFVVAVDTCSGGTDYTAAQFLSKTKIDVPLVFHSRTTTSDFIPKLADMLNKLHTITGIRPVVALERQNGGSFLMDRLSAINYTNQYEIFKMPNFGREDAPDPVRLGWDTSSATRPKMLQDLKDAIDKKGLTIYDESTINEMFAFVVVQTSSSWKAQAEKHSHDDLIMALAIAWQMYQICSTPITSEQMANEINQLPVEPWKKAKFF